MKRKVIFILTLSFFLFCMISPSLAEEGKRLTLTLKDGRVSADIYNVTLEEIAKEIGKKWGISVELYGRFDKDRLVSAQFQDLPPLESLYRLLRNINFLLIEGERLCLMGFSETVLKNGTMQVMANLPSIRDLSSENILSLVSKEVKGPLNKSGTIDRKSETMGGQRRGSWASINKSKSELSTGAVSITSERPPSGVADQGMGSKTIDASFTIPIILEATGKAISCLSNDIVYDPNLLANPRVTISDSAKEAGKEVVFNEVRPGLLRVGVIGLNQNVIPDGVTANVTFDVLREGEIFLINQPTASDPHGNKIPVIFRDGKIRIAK